jgi:hypothetical protein
MPFDSYGAPQYGLSDCVIAPWTATGTYGSSQDVMSVQMLSTVMRVVSAELTGDDVITATASRAVGAQITMRMGGVSLPVLEIMTGNSATSSVSSPNEVTNLRISGGERLPYFAICGKALAEEGDGDFLVFVAKCKVMGDLNLVQLEYGSFAIPEMTVMAVPDGDYGILSLVERETAAAITIPPANIPTIA